MLQAIRVAIQWDILSCERSFASLVEEVGKSGQESRKYQVKKGVE